MSLCSWRKRASWMRFWAAPNAFHTGLMGVVGGLVMAAFSSAYAASSPLAGTWLVKEKDGIFLIQSCQNDAAKLCGYLVGMDYTEAEPEKDYTGHSECGMEIISDMIPRKNGHWHGTVLNPRTGSRYQASMWLAKDGTLKLRGYVGLSLFGQTQTWSRIDSPAIGAQCRMQKGG